MMEQFKMKNIFQWGVLASTLALAFPDAALAAVIGDSLNIFRTDDVGQVPLLINSVAFIGGAVLVVNGALKLKAHTENPGQNKLAPGIGYLLAGGALAGLPFLVQTALDTLHLTGDLEFVPITFSEAPV